MFRFRNHYAPEAPKNERRVIGESLGTGSIDSSARFRPHTRPLARDARRRLLSPLIPQLGAREIDAPLRRDG